MVHVDGDTHTHKFTGLEPGTRYTADVTGYAMDGEELLASPVGSDAGTTC